MEIRNIKVKEVKYPSIEDIKNKKFKYKIIKTGVLSSLLAIISNKVLAYTYNPSKGMRPGIDYIPGNAEHVVTMSEKIGGFFRIMSLILFLFGIIKFVNSLIKWKKYDEIKKKKTKILIIVIFVIDIIAFITSIILFHI